MAFTVANITVSGLTADLCQLKTSHSLSSSFRVQAVTPVVRRRSTFVSASVSENDGKVELVSRRTASQAALFATLAALATPLPARADFIETYREETKDVIERVKSTLSLERGDPAASDAVDALRVLSNDWVAKYRREKAVAGKPSFSNMYSALNAISGHYISFGNGYPIPKKRAQRILEEVNDAERALTRGR